MKRIPSFDYAQDGEPVEPYLANKDTRYSNALFALRFTLASLSRSGLHEIRATKNEVADRLRLGSQRRTIAADMFRNTAG